MVTMVAQALNTKASNSRAALQEAGEGPKNIRMARDVASTRTLDKTWYKSLRFFSKGTQLSAQLQDSDSWEITVPSYTHPSNLSTDGWPTPWWNCETLQVRRQVRRHEQAFIQAPIFFPIWWTPNRLSVGIGLVIGLLTSQAAQRFTEVANQPLGHGQMHFLQNCCVWYSQAQEE